MAMRRKNLILEEDKLKALAARPRVNESEAARRAAVLALAGEEVAGAPGRLRARGTLDDAYRRAST